MNNKGFYYLAPVLIILALGLVLLPESKHSKELNPRHLLLEINDQTRFQSTDQVAKAIINKDPFYALVDVRTAAEYSAWTLPDALNIPLADILKPENSETLNQSSRRIVFFSNNDIYAEQAWLLCKRSGYKNIFVMKGGLNAWMQTILTPTEPPVTASKADFEQFEFRKAASQFFKGTAEEGDKEKGKREKEKGEREKEKVKVTPVVKPSGAEGGC
jgi:rhodanese-related sulfurtransferase